MAGTCHVWPTSVYCDEMTDAELAAPEFVHLPENRRYTLELDGKTVCVSVYSDHLKQRTFLHTEVDPEFGGRGLATRLIRESLDDCREHGYTVVARCPSVASFLAKNPEYQDLVAR
jgi:predicted GNAT family acetyltransferase